MSENKVDLFEQRRCRALNQIISFRKSAVDDVDFGRKVTFVIAELLAHEEYGRPREGWWDDDERAILKEAFANNADSSDAAIEAGKKLFRTRRQILSMAGNLRLKKPCA